MGQVLFAAALLVATGTALAVASPNVEAARILLALGLLAAVVVVFWDQMQWWE